MTTIGNINGKWAVLFKASLAVIAIAVPISIPWATWVTVSIIRTQSFNEQGPRFTRDDAAQLEERVITGQAVIRAAAAAVATEKLNDHILVGGHAGMSQRVKAIELDSAVVHREMDQMNEKLDRLLELTIELRTTILKKDDKP